MVLVVLVVLVVYWSGEGELVEGGVELCSGVEVGWWVVVGLEVLGGLGGVLLLVGEAEEGGACSWLIRSWSPTYWTSCLLEEEELLGARTWRSSSQGFEGWGGRRTIAVSRLFP